MIAEQFTSEAPGLAPERLADLARLAQPALRQALLLDRFPMRGCLRWADRWAELQQRWGLTQWTLATVAALAIVLALVWVARNHFRRRERTNARGEVMA